MGESHSKANQTRSFVAISGGREWTVARPDTSSPALPAGGISHIMCCMNSGPVYPSTPHRPCLFSPRYSIFFKKNCMHGVLNKVYL